MKKWNSFSVVDQNDSKKQQYLPESLLVHSSFLHFQLLPNFAPQHLRTLLPCFILPNAYRININLIFLFENVHTDIFKDVDILLDYLNCWFMDCVLTPES